MPLTREGEDKVNEGEQVFTITCGDVSSNVTVSAEDFEGSCVNPHNANIPQSYIGEYEIPLPENSFGDEHLRGMGFKDYGVKWIYQAYSDSYHYDNEVEIATVDLIEQKATAYIEHAYYCLDSQPCWSKTSSDTSKHKMVFNLPA